MPEFNEAENSDKVFAEFHERFGQGKTQKAKLPPSDYDAQLSAKAEAHIMRDQHPGNGDDR